MKGKPTKILCLGLTLVVMLMTTFSGCTRTTDKAAVSAATETATEAAAQEETITAESPANLDPVKLVWYMIGASPQNDESTVFEAASKYAKEKINAEVSFVMFNWGDYSQKMQVKIASSEKFDICFTADWANNYYANIGKGAFLDITDLVPKYAPKKYAAIPKFVWEGLKVNGKLYGVINGFIPWADGCFLRKDLVEKYNFDYKNVKNFMELEPFFKIVKENEPDLIPYGMPDIAGNENFQTMNIEAIIGSHMPGVIRRDDPNLIIMNQYELPEMKEHLKLKHDWYKKNYIIKDVASRANLFDLYKAKKMASSFTSAYYTGSEEELTVGMYNGVPIVAAVWGNPFLTADSILKTINAISATSENPERAVMLLELSNTDRDFFKLLGAGIKGVHYEDIGNNTIKFLNQDYQPGNNWAWGDLDRNGYVTEGSPANMLEGKARSGEKATPSLALGFGINTETIKTEYAQIASVVDEYARGLLSGAAAPEKNLDEFNEKLKAAGLNTFLAEIQKQLDAYKSQRN